MRYFILLAVVSLFNLPTQAITFNPAALLTVSYAQKANRKLNTRARLHLALSKNKSELHVAVLTNRSKKIKDLLAQGMDVNKVDPVTKLTPLHVASMLFNFKMARLLLDKGADVNAVGGMGGFTPLHLAMIKDMDRSLKVAKLLIKNGASLNHQGIQGWTPLHYAAIHSNKRGAKLLIAQGANPHLKDKGPIGLAGSESSRKIHELNAVRQKLIKSNQRTATDWAMENGDKELAKIVSGL